ncbi:hypothetical protein RJ639_035284 [Escallonia herrerae]|uniref:Cation/H+ exchanger domain-containing protein n=1 Tax=Escallonia herrerae TaxID=1293975 RepID=A0AA88WQ38_9ASTE|nr:hypothetical protein RJ639_035284 [Escallonia herrerae]
MQVNKTSVKTSSDGVWQGDNPLDFAFPLLVVQTTLILVVSRFLSLLFKPLRQPKVIAEIVGGIILGPSAFGRNQEYMHQIFPKWSTPILESVASIGLLFFLFLVGLELDLNSIRHSGKKAVGIAAAGISIPFILGIGITFVLRKTIEGADKVGYIQYVVFMGVALSITAFPVLARILAELKLLTTQVGETAMAAAAFNDVVAWILLALAVAIAGDGGAGGPHKSPLISIWVLLSGHLISRLRLITSFSILSVFLFLHPQPRCMGLSTVSDERPNLTTLLISGFAFVVFMMVAIRPAMKWVARRCSPEHDVVDEAYICLTLAGVLVSGFITDLIGIHSIFGAFVFGLTIPKGGDFAERLIERIEDFVSGLLLPLYFASSGLKTDVAKIRGGKSWGLLLLVITTACAGKITGTFASAMLCMIPAREAITLGLLMNTKGLVELIVLNIGKEKKVLNDEAFAILVLMALFTTFMTTPTVMAIYKPSRGSSTTVHRRLEPVSETLKDELRVLACVHGSGNIPSLINLIESTRSVTKTSLKLYIMHLVELTERSSSIMMVHRLQKNGFPFTKRYRDRELHGRVAFAFQAYGQLGRVSVRTTTAISPLATLHEDIRHVAEEKNVPMIILPFHKRWRKEDGDVVVEHIGHGWRAVNQKVLKSAPCSVAVLVDRGYGSDPQQTPGPTGPSEQRGSFGIRGRMVDHPSVKVTVIRFVKKEGVEGKGVMLRPSPNKATSENHYTFSTAAINLEKEKGLDEGAVNEFQKRWEGMVDYREKVATNIVEGVLEIGRSGDYDLVIVGKGRCPSTMVAELADRQAEHAELGPIGDLLASSGVSSVLIIQQHDTILAEEAPVSKVMQSEEDGLTAYQPSIEV